MTGEKLLTSLYSTKTLFYPVEKLQLNVFEEIDIANNSSTLRFVGFYINENFDNPVTILGGTRYYQIFIDGVLFHTYQSNSDEWIIPRYNADGETINSTAPAFTMTSFDKLPVVEHESNGSKNILVEAVVLYNYTNPDTNVQEQVETFRVSGRIDLTQIGDGIEDFKDIDKQALKNNTAAIKTRLRVLATPTQDELILTEENCIKSLLYSDERYVPDQGWIGQFVARTLEGELHEISEDFNIENREVEFQLGILHQGSGTLNWYNYGNFIVTKPESNEVIDNTKFTSMDYTKKFNQSFDGDFTNDDYPDSLNTKIVRGETYTPRWLAGYTCAQVGVQFSTKAFVNESFTLYNNPFKNNETCRDVMKEIAKLAFSWVRINWNNICCIDFNEQLDVTDSISNNEYFTLETQKEIYGPINKVVFGMSGIDGESVREEDPDSINENGEHAIYIYDNPLLDTYDLRAEAVKQGTVLFGLQYIPLKTETVGHPWLKGNKLIYVLDMNNNVKPTYPFNRQLKYSGHIRSIIESTGETEVEATYSYSNEILKELRNAMIRVDKQEGIITEHTSRLEVVEDEFGNYYTIEKTNELINDAKSGLTNTYTTSGGNNIFKNTGLYFEEGSGYEYWDGPIAVKRNVDSASGTSMLLQNGTATQSVTDLPNGDYTISFGYIKLNELSTASVIINAIKYDLGNQGKFELPIVVDANTIEISFICDTNNGYEIWEVMCNRGTASQPWTQHANEVRTDMVNISKGITIKSSTINTTFKADADGIRIENNDSKETTNFTEQGMETDVAVVRVQGQITGALFNKVGNQTWINGL